LDTDESGSTCDGSLSQVGTVPLPGSLSSGDLGSSSRRGASSESDVRSGTSDLVRLGVGLELGDHNLTIFAGVDADALGV